MVWDMRSGQCVQAFETHESDVNSVRSVSRMFSYSSVLLGTLAWGDSEPTTASRFSVLG